MQALGKATTHQQEQAGGGVLGGDHEWEGGVGITCYASKREARGVRERGPLR